MDNEGTISVVVCAHALDRTDSLRAAIRSIESQDRAPFEIIVVCDGNEALAAIVKTEFPDIVTVANDGRKGLSGARNTGVRRARGDVVAFLDDDAVAEPDWLSRISHGYRDPAVMAVGGLIVPVWPDGRPSWFPEEFDWVIGCSYRGLPTRAASVRNLIGCNMSVRRDVLIATGAFREDLGRDGDNASGCEETELFIRARAAFPDRIVRYDPLARVRHFIAPNRTRWRYFADRCRAEGRSKAAMVRSVGVAKGLSSENAYTLKVLPAAVGRGLFDALRGEPAALLRSGATVAGFFLVASSYLRGRLGQRTAPRGAGQPFRPLSIVDADLDAGLPDLPGRDPVTGERYGGAWCLVRSAGQPVKIVEVSFEDDGLSAADFAAAVERDTTPRPAPPIPTTTGADGPSVTVIIATRDRADSLARCLESLLAQTYDNFDIVVVDNAPSSSVTADLVAKAYAPTGRVRYVREDRPGLGLAHNAGLPAATGDVVAFTDDDVIVDPRWVATIAANFALSDRVGCVTGLILPAELLTRAQYWTERHGGFGKGLSRRVFDLGLHRPSDPLFPYTAGGFGSGANMAFSREALSRAGGFDPALGAGTPACGGDDLAAFVAVVRAGYQLVYEPGAIVWHHHRRNEDGMRRQAYGYGVGLGAYLTKQVVDDPSVALTFARRLPSAIAHMFGRSSAKLKRLPEDYPRQLVWRERLGILMGAPGYIRSRYGRRRRSPPQVGGALSASKAGN